MKALPPVVLVLSLAGSAASPPPAIAGPVSTADSIRYSVRVTDINAVGLTITNYGVIGNNFVSRTPSLEYPLGTGYEHLPVGGLWFGAHAVDDAGAFTGVSTGAQDGAIGGSTQQITEFTPAGLDIQLRSRIPSSRYFDPAAVSDMDYVWTFSDRPARSISGEPHRPLNILVRGTVFSWNSDGLRDFLILRFVVINLGEAPLNDAWAGLWTEFASGDKNGYSCWPPSSACSSTGSWFSKKWLQKDFGSRLVREHYCAALPVPEGCFLDRVPAWIGLELLGTGPDPIGGKRWTLAAWSYSPHNPLRDEDTERYAIMSAGTIQNLTQPELMPQTGDPVELLAVGPFAHVAPGDSVTVDFALVGGGEAGLIQANAVTAQVFYDNGFSLPTSAGIAPVSGFTLSGVRPNPSAGALAVSFSLPDAAPARIDLWDVAGRLIRTREVGSLGAGSHVVDVAGRDRLPAGVYLVRLARQGQVLTARAVVVH